MSGVRVGEGKEDVEAELTTLLTLRVEGIRVGRVTEGREEVDMDAGVNLIVGKVEEREGGDRGRVRGARAADKEEVEVEMEVEVDVDWAPVTQTGRGIIKVRSRE